MRQFTVAHTPKQNGVVERMNKTLLERTRAMLRTAGLAKSFWAEVVKTAYYTINRSPSSVIGLNTPMEMWKGNRIEYSTLHVVGCPVYVMYNSQERTKLDPKSRKCIFLGYVDGVKGYLLWDPTSRKVIVSRDVIFAENELQREQENDTTSKDITTVHIDGKSIEDYSLKAKPEHEV